MDATKEEPVIKSSASRSFTWARILALLLTTGLLLGLTYLRFASRPETVAVPQGAHAGQLTMHPCTYPTENGSYRADCGTLVVPEDRADPHSRLIALPVIRIRARSRHPLAPIFHLNGGPGQTNMEFPEASRLAARHDVVMVGYRGVDGSSVLNCPEVTAALASSADFLGSAVDARLRPGLRRVRAPARARGRRPRGLHAGGAGRRHRGRPCRARLPARRPAQRERRDPPRDDLRVALPERRRTLGDDRGQPARQLTCTAEPRSIRGSSATRRSARRTRPAAAGPPTWPRPCGTRRRTCQAGGSSSRSSRATPASRRSSGMAEATESSAAADRTDHAELVDLRRARRPERPVADVAAGRPHPPRVVHLG